MRKFLAAPAVLTLLLTLGGVRPASADTDIFGSYVVLSLNGGVNTFYDLSSATNNPDFQGAFLGTFNPSAGDTLILNGGEVDTYKNGTSNVTAAFTNYNVHLTINPQGTFTGINLPFNSEFPNFGSNTGDQKWQLTNLGPNLLASLAPGAYSFAVFSSANTSDGDRFASNGGNNYVATFNVVPEPSANVLATTIGALALGLLAWPRLRRATR